MGCSNLRLMILWIMPSFAAVQHDVRYPVRAEGTYSVPTNPWPRDQEKEKHETMGIVYRRGNPMSIKGKVTRWDQYGESSSAASSEAHIMSEQVNT